MVGQNIELRRRVLGWTLERLAGEAGVDTSTVSRAEAANSNPKPETLAKIAEALGCTADDLRIPLSEDAKSELRLIAASRALPSDQRLALLTYIEQLAGIEPAETEGARQEPLPQKSKRGRPRKQPAALPAPGKTGTGN